MDENTQPPQNFKGDDAPEGKESGVDRAHKGNEPKGRRAKSSAPAFVPVWIKGGMLDENGRLIHNLVNALAILRSHPVASAALAYDDMLGVPVVIGPLPEHRVKGTERADRRLLTDSDVSQFQEWMQQNGLPKIGNGTVHQAVIKRARECSFHPVRDYLNGLVWDGHPRLNMWLAGYLGVEESPYAEFVGRAFLIAMVARIFKPGCKQDYMPVFESRQGVMKSTVCETLAGEWFSDCLPSLNAGKDVEQHLQGKWLIEIAELSSLSRVGSDKIKEFISKKSDRYRPSYGRLEITVPRQCCFAGTTNKDTYLKDETGARRFWPLKVGMHGGIFLDNLKHDRDQLFAEATYLFKAGEKWWPDPKFEAEHIKPQQDARFESDAWEAPIAEYAAGKPRLPSVCEIAKGALGLDVARVGKLEQLRIVKILAHLGWEPRKSNGKRGFSRPEK